MVTINFVTVGVVSGVADFHTSFYGNTHGIIVVKRAITIWAAKYLISDIEQYMDLGNLMIFILK